MNITHYISILLACIFIGLLIYLTYVQIKEAFESNDPKLIELYNKISPVHPIIPSLSFYVGDSSYTLNKEKIYMCMKDKNNVYYDMNTLVYVSLHEVAHVLCDEIGHTQKFQDIFDDLLDSAIEQGIFNPSIPIVDNYCPT